MESDANQMLSRPWWKFYGATTIIPSSTLQSSVSWVQGTRAFCQRHDIPIIVHHTSGHAGIADLQRLAEALKPGRVVPIHTAAPERFAQHFKNVALSGDGLWREV
ncbi:MAG: MBL fold metallo-hydrolase RNA specificity domain-containing protein [Polyangia bacterium]